MSYEVLFTDDASRDLEDICQFIAFRDEPAKAEYVLTQIETTCERLSEFPFRGFVPDELEEIGIDDFREVHFKPYRIIYTIMGTTVYIVAIIDGRRDMETLLHRRILKHRPL